MVDRVLVSKARSLERCIARVNEHYVGHEDELAISHDRQDIIVLNLIRACEQAIDMANRTVLLRRLEIADGTSAIFTRLGEAGIITPDLARSMQAMVGFRNIAVHEYATLDIEKLREIVERRTGDLLAFGKALLTADPEPPAAA